MRINTYLQLINVARTQQNRRNTWACKQHASWDVRDASLSLQQHQGCDRCGQCCEWHRLQHLDLGPRPNVLHRGACWQRNTCPSATHRQVATKGSTRCCFPNNRAEPRPRSHVPKDCIAAAWPPASQSLQPEQSKRFFVTASHLRWTMRYCEFCRHQQSNDTIPRVNQR